MYNDFKRATINNNSVRMQKIIDQNKDFDINYKYENGRTALYFAVLYESIDAVNFLLKHPKIQIDLVDQFKKKPLHVAAIVGNVEIAEILLKAYSSKKLNIQSTIEKCNWSPLHLVINMGFESFTEMKKLCTTPSHFGLMDSSGTEKYFKNLPRNGPEWKWKNLGITTYTPHSKNKNILNRCTLIKLLIQYGHQVNVTDDKENTPSHYVSIIWYKTNNNTKLSMLLLDNGADKWCQNNNNEISLEIWAKNKGNLPGVSPSQKKKLLADTANLVTTESTKKLIKFEHVCITLLRTSNFPLPYDVIPIIFGYIELFRKTVAQVENRVRFFCQEVAQGKKYDEIKQSNEYQRLDNTNLPCSNS